MKRSLVLPIGISVTALVGLSVFGLTVLTLAILTPRPVLGVLLAPIGPMARGLPPDQEVSAPTED